MKDTPHINTALDGIIGYLLDEEKHWEESGKPDNHIWISVQAVQAWLANRNISITSSANPDAMEIEDLRAMRMEIAERVSELRRLDDCLEVIISGKKLRLAGKIKSAIELETIVAPTVPCTTH